MTFEWTVKTIPRKNAQQDGHGAISSMQLQHADVKAEM